MREIASELVMAWGLRLLGVGVALYAAWIISGWARRAMLASFERTGFDATLWRFFANVVRYALLAAAVLGCLGVFGIQTTSFAALIAASGLAIGLAFQGTLSNFAAGTMLLVFRPFKVGDVVVVDGMTGTVQEIELFTTDLTTLDNRRVIMPNSSIFGNRIENLSYYPTRRIDLPVGTDYAADIDRTREVLEGVVAKTEGVLEDPPIQVVLAELGDSSINWKLRAWCNSEDYWDVWQRLIRNTKVALDEAGIGIPFPQRDLHVDEDLIKALRPT
jgi:small conductance mechanosensitive channel